MHNPKTIEEATAYRYTEWAGNQDGTEYDPKRCAYEVWPSSRWLPAQCLRKNGYGPDHLYCKQHAKKLKMEA